VSSGGVHPFTTIFTQYQTGGHAITDAQSSYHNHGISIITNIGYTDTDHFHYATLGGGVTDFRNLAHYHGSLTYNWTSNQQNAPGGTSNRVTSIGNFTGAGDSAYSGGAIAQVHALDHQHGGVSVSGNTGWQRDAHATNNHLHGGTSSGTIDYRGGNQAHTHPYDIRVRYLDVIIATKN
jgi:hypothetical protein